MARSCLNWPARLWSRRIPEAPERRAAVYSEAWRQETASGADQPAARRGLSAYLLDVLRTTPNHEDAHEWFRAPRKRGWATCPFTIHGFVRVVSSPGYPTIEASLAEAASRLRAFCAGPDHQFWPDDLSLLDETRFRLAVLQGPQQITDVYLVALAVRNGGRLATFDRAIPWKAVTGAEARHLELLGSRPV